ncbi:GGDEF domain-containing protein [Kaarinaea lacus]
MHKKLWLLTINKLVKYFRYHRRDFALYFLYMLIGCAITSGLNIVHTKYILGMTPYAELFIVPTVAGVIFGYLTARIRLASHIIRQQNDMLIMVKHIITACFITSALNVVHTEWVLGQQLSLELFIAPVIAGIFFGFLIARIKILNNQLLKLATTDILTHTANRMQFDTCLDQAIQKAQRSKHAFSIIYFDIDHFKQINDRFGHHTGDLILVNVAHQVRQALRPQDMLSRYGGDEFIILAPYTSVSEAFELAENIKHRIQDNVHVDPIEKVSCSFGVVEYNSSHESVLSLLKDADHALYSAKNDGRNCVATLAQVATHA